MIKKRLALVIGVIATLLLALSGTASAQNNGEGWTVDVIHGERSFVVASPNVTDPDVTAQCPLLPSSVKVTGSGHDTMVIKTRVGRDGITYSETTDEVRGSATDQAGNKYQFSYDNRVKEISTNGTDFVGIMFDDFRMKGGGPANLHNGFVAVVRHDVVFSYFEADPISQFGQPFNFPSGPGICDPL